MKFKVGDIISVHANANKWEVVECDNDTETYRLQKCGSSRSSNFFQSYIEANFSIAKEPEIDYMQDLSIGDSLYSKSFDYEWIVENKGGYLNGAYYTITLKNVNSAIPTCINYTIDELRRNFYRKPKTVEPPVKQSEHHEWVMKINKWLERFLSAYVSKSVFDEWWDELTTDDIIAFRTCLALSTEELLLLKNVTLRLGQWLQLAYNASNVAETDACFASSSRIQKLGKLYITLSINYLK